MATVGRRAGYNDAEGSSNGTHNLFPVHYVIYFRFGFSAAEGTLLLPRCAQASIGRALQTRSLAVVTGTKHRDRGRPEIDETSSIVDVCVCV